MFVELSKLKYGWAYTVIVGFVLYQKSSPNIIKNTIDTIINIKLKTPPKFVFKCLSEFE